MMSEVKEVYLDFCRLYRNNSRYYSILSSSYWDILKISSFKYLDLQYAWYLLRREIPMAWGTTTDSLTPEINIFQYEIEIKCLTLKDQTSYLIPDGWSRSPFSFAIFSLNWYITSSTTSKQYKHSIYHGVRSILAYIINNVQAFDIIPWIKYSFKHKLLDRKIYFY